MKLTLLTTTCHRPEAWAICEKYIAAQTRKPDQWLVLDDDEIKTVCTKGQDYHYWPECRGRGSLTRKITKAVKENLITGDAVVVVENDDAYAPTYLENVEKWLQTADLVGEGDSLYYNVRERVWFSHRNSQHASFCATAFKVSLFPQLLKACNTDCPYVDIRLWNYVQSPFKKRVIMPSDYPASTRLTVGIKGMPGTRGYGAGHTMTGARGTHKDPGLAKLTSLLGKDAEAYRIFGEPIVPVKPEPIPEIKMPSKPLSETDQVHGPKWETWLALLKNTPAIGLEIGTCRGESAESMCTRIFTHPKSEYYCVDTFAGSPEYDKSVDFSEVETAARERLKSFKNVKIMKGFSHEVLKKIKTPLDAVYIDGGHDSLNVIRDSVLAFDLLKVGGVMIWDDYGWTLMPNDIDRPKLAIDFFLKTYSRHLKVNFIGWQVCATKTS